MIALYRRGNPQNGNSILISSEIKNSNRTAPGERERVRTLSHPVTRGGLGERSAPMSRVVGNQNSRQNSPGELERVAVLSNFNQKDFPQGNRIRVLQGVAVAGELAPAATSLYAHHISPLLSKIITSFSMAIAFSSPSVGVIRLSSCSMEIIPS